MTQINVDIPPEIYNKIELKRAQESKKNKNVVINDILFFFFEEVEPTD